MASEPRPGSTHGATTRTPPPAPVIAPAYTSYVQNCVVLLDWWLERVEGQDGKIRVAGYTTRNQDTVSHSANRKRPARLFTSDSITMRHADGTLETADLKIVLIRGPLNIPQMHQNGFPDEVSDYFQLGFPVQWEKYINSNMKQKNEHAQSPSKSTEYYIEKLLRGSSINSMGYTSTGNFLPTSEGSTGNTDGPPIQRLSKLSNGTPRFQESDGNTADNDNMMSMAASEDLCNISMDMPEETFTEPRETCNSCQADGKFDGMHIDASEVAHSIDSALVNNQIDKIIPDLAEIGTPKCGKTSVHLGTEDALDVPTKGITPQFWAVQGSENNTIRRLRNGKLFGMSNLASLKKGYSKRKTMQHETFNMKMISNEELTPSADQTSHEHGGSVSPIIAADKLQSHDSRHRGRGRPRKRARSTVQ